MNCFITTYQEHLHARVKKESPMMSVEFIFKSNILTFDFFFFFLIFVLQTKVTGMNTMFAPYAMDTTGYAEIKLYFN